MLECFGLKIFDHSQGLPLPEEPIKFEPVERDTPDGVVEYLSEERTRQAILVFSSTEWKNEILKVNGFAEDLDGAVDHDNL